MGGEGGMRVVLVFGTLGVGEEGCHLVVRRDVAQRMGWVVDCLIEMEKTRWKEDEDSEGFRKAAV